MKELEQAITVIIQAVQDEVFGETLRSQHYVHVSREESSLERISERKRILKKSTLFRLDPFIGDDGILRVGGRLWHARLE